MISSTRFKEMCTLDERISDFQHQVSCGLMRLPLYPYLGCVLFKQINKKKSNQKLDREFVTGAGDTPIRFQPNIIARLDSVWSGGDQL